MGQKQVYLYPSKLTTVSKNINGYRYTIIVTSLQGTYYEDDSKDYFWSETKSYLLIKKP